MFSVSMLPDRLRNITVRSHKELREVIRAAVRNSQLKEKRGEAAEAFYEALRGGLIRYPLSPGRVLELMNYAYESGLYKKELQKLQKEKKVFDPDLKVCVYEQEVLKDAKDLAEFVYNVVGAIPRKLKKSIGITASDWILLHLSLDMHFPTRSTEVLESIKESLKGRFRSEEVWKKYVERNNIILKNVKNDFGVLPDVRPDLVPKSFRVRLERAISDIIYSIPFELDENLKKAFTESFPTHARIPSYDFYEVTGMWPGKLAERIVRDYWVYCSLSEKTREVVAKVERKWTKYLPFNTYCPICKDFVKGSEYLYDEAFPDDCFAYWIANLVTHYRHHHIRYYDLSWRYWSYGDKNPEYQKLGHDGFRTLVNNRAKRQLIRAILKDENLSECGKRELIRAVLKLQYNDEKTVELVNKSLKKLEQGKTKSKSTRTRRKKKTRCKKSRIELADRQGSI